MMKESDPKRGLLTSEIGAEFRDIAHIWFTRGKEDAVSD